MMALIVDLDTGIPGEPPPNTSNFPANFSAAYAIHPGVQSPTYFHGGLMAQRFAVAEAAQGRHDTMTELVVTDATNMANSYALAGSMDWVAHDLVPKVRRHHPHEPIVVAVPLSGPLHYYDALSIIKSEKDLGRAGIAMSVAAGDNGQKNAANDAEWQFGSWPVDGAAYGATNVMPVAASDPSGQLQPWSNTGPTAQLVVKAKYGTSEASILGAIALATTEDATKRGVSMKYATKVVQETIATS